MPKQFERLQKFPWPPVKGRAPGGRDVIPVAASQPAEDREPEPRNSPQARWAMPTEEEMAWDEEQEAELDEAKLAWKPDEYDN